MDTEPNTASLLAAWSPLDEYLSRAARREINRRAKALANAQYERYREELREAYRKRRVSFVEIAEWFPAGEAKQ